MDISAMLKNTTAIVQQNADPKKEAESIANGKFGGIKRSQFEKTAKDLLAEGDKALTEGGKSTELDMYHATLYYSAINPRATMDEFKEDFSKGLKAQGVSDKQAREAIDKFLALDYQAIPLSDGKQRVADIVTATALNGQTHVLDKDIKRVTSARKLFNLPDVDLYK